MKTIIKPLNNFDTVKYDSLSKVTIIVYLYYEETVDNYLEYLANIPIEYDIILISSKQSIIEYVKKRINNLGVRIKEYVLKQNRGRDVSALIVSAKEYVLNSDYICFVHDKAANFDYLKNDVDFWVMNLWENTLGSQAFIRNIVKLFDNDKKLGGLFPPSPIGKYIDAWIDNNWGDNFDNVKKLSNDLGLRVDIKYDAPFISLSNVFWARVESIKAIFKIDWGYDDFDVEPLPIDGTLSHAIERIWGYIILDKGYESGIIMNDEYAGNMISKSEEYSKVMYRFIKNHFPVVHYAEIETLDQRLKILSNYIMTHDRLFIFGAGKYGIKLKQYLNYLKANFKGFIVSGNIDSEEDNIISISSYIRNENDGILIAVSLEKKDEIEKILKEYGIVDYIYGY